MPVYLKVPFSFSIPTVIRLRPNSRRNLIIQELSVTSKTFTENTLIRPLERIQSVDVELFFFGYTQSYTGLFWSHKGYGIRVFYDKSRYLPPTVLLSSRINYLLTYPLRLR